MPHLIVDEVRSGLMREPRAFWRNDGERRLTVLVADDNALILEKVSTLLARNFDLVAAVTDGRQALDAALRLDPDVVVLDVTMPELDGFQTARELRRAGSRAKIVMLTMHQSDDYVAAAIESWAQGYVLKTRMHVGSRKRHRSRGRRPSLRALPHSLSCFAPAQGLAGMPCSSTSTIVAILNELSRLLSAALHRGDVTAIVATDATRAAIAQRLIASGCDIARAADRGKYISLDAAAALSQVMVDGRLDASRLAAMVDDLERSRLAASASHLTIVGEMSALLCRDGNPEAAIQLEQRLGRPDPRASVLSRCASIQWSASVREETPDSFQASALRTRSVCHAHDA